MLYHRPAQDRGHANFGWLDSYHSFSFGNYYDPKHMGLSALRVINDDTVAAGGGFGTHGHRDMEIISYVLEGAIEHKDSMGNQHIVPAGVIQRMSAGSGVTHSEFNHSKNDRLKFLQIWIQPNELGIKPEYEQMAVKQKGKMTALVTPDGADQSLRQHQDASIYRIVLKKDETVVLQVDARTGYLHVIEGAGQLDDTQLKAGDGMGLIQEQLVLSASEDGLTALWFDLPATDGANN